MKQENEIHYLLDCHGNFTFLNEAGERILGYSCEEVRQMNVVQVVAPEVSNHLREQIQQISKQVFGGVYEVEVITKSGGRVRLEVSTSAVSREGMPVEIHGFAVPVCWSPEQPEPMRQRCLHGDFFVGSWLYA